MAIEWKAIILGQWISFLIAGTGIFASLLSSHNLNFPSLMSFCNYALLSTFLIRKFTLSTATKNIFIDTKASTLINKSHLFYWYMLAAVLDVEANFFVTLAYNYTNITSVMLLDCFTIPCAMALSYTLMGCRYTYKHFIGTCFCLSGLICIILNDSINGNNSTSINPILGDIFCLIGAALYACSNVLQENLVKYHDREEFLGYLGSFGSIIAFTQCMIIDLPSIERAEFNFEFMLYMFGFILCLFLMYTNTSSLLQISDSILFNLSLLTSDVYAVLFTYFFESYLVSWLYFLSFGLVMIGLIIYHSEKKPTEVGMEVATATLLSSFYNDVEHLNDDNYQLGSYTAHSMNSQ
jgi:solute carrier family 35 protein F1/2